MMRRTPLFFFLFLLLSLFLSSSARGGAMTGGWSPIKNLSDPHVLEIASFAVAEHNKAANQKLALQRVVSGETQVVSGVNYRIVIAAAGGEANKYQAVVLEKAWMRYKSLTSFKTVS